MNVKCPICKFDTTNNPNSTGLFRHLMDKHTDHEVTSYLVGLLFRIDEKIESLENWDISEGVFSTTKKIEIKELKSLLEFEK